MINKIDKTPIIKMPSISYQLHAIESAKRNMYTDSCLWSDKVKESSIQNVD